MPSPFSLAYVRIGAAVGALVLFGVVQLTMVGYGLASGERPSLRTWAGLAPGDRRPGAADGAGGHAVRIRSASR